jgi:hypothetical protein
MDGKIDDIDFEIEIQLKEDEDLYAVTLLLLFDYRLNVNNKHFFAVNVSVNMNKLCAISFKKSFYPVFTLYPNNTHAYTYTGTKAR